MFTIDKCGCMAMFLSVSVGRITISHKQSSSGRYIFWLDLTFLLGLIEKGYFLLEGDYDTCNVHSIFLVANSLSSTLYIAVSVSSMQQGKIFILVSLLLVAGK